MRNLFISFILVACMQLQAKTNPIMQLGIEQGLSNNYVIGITQDRDGFMWFATEEGLNKFDGTRFINYYKHTGSVSGNELNCVYADPVEPVIWVATQRAGLNAYNYERKSLTVYSHNDNDPSSLITNDVTDIKPAADGNLWISTYHRGVDYLNKATGEFTHYNSSLLPNFPSDNVWTIMDDGIGNLYIGHVVQGMSVISLKDKRVKHFKHAEGVAGSIPGNDVRCIYKDSNNNIWVGTDKGLSLFNAETGTFIVPDNFPRSLVSSYVFDIRQMEDNKLWIATELNGIYIIDLKQHFFNSPGSLSSQHLTVGNNKYSLSNPTVRKIFQDSFKNIWIGTYGGGINFTGYNPPLFDAYTYSPIPGEVNSLNNRVVMSLCTDAQDRLWIGTDGGGVNVFENGKRVAIYSKESGDLTHNSVVAAFRDSHDNIWLGTFSGGLNYYDNRTKRFRSIPLDGQTNHDVRCFLEDHNGDIWVGTNKGIFVMNALTQSVRQHYNKDNKLPEDLIRSIAQDEQGRIWIGTFGRGLSVYTPGMQPIEAYEEYDGFSSNTINYIFRDSQNQMWIGTGEGLVRFAAGDSLHYQVFGREDGLQNTFIRAIAEDEAGNIWLSTNAGISCYHTARGQFSNYNHFDKTPMGSFMTAFTADNNGTMYFGSLNGVRYFDPLAVLTNREAPPATITELSIFAGQSAPEESRTISYFNDANRNIRLNHRQNTFSVTFNVQDYSLSDQVDYAYRLKGLEDAWYIVDDNNVVFRNILPGHYEFEVKTRIRNQEWTSHTASLSIDIAPPLWQAWWAKFIYCVAAALIIFALLYAYKKKVEIQSSYEMEKKSHEQEQELNNERLRFYTNIAHELRTPLTLILGPLEDLQNDEQLQPKQVQKISVVHQSAIRLLNLINQIMEFRKTETQNKKLSVSKGNIATVVKEIGLKYKELNRKPDVEFIISASNDNMQLFFDKEIVTIVLDNLVSNALKYTDKGCISLSLYNTTRNDLEYTEIRVTDTGHGIPGEDLERIFDRYYQARSDKQASGTGIGLALVKNLVALHEGDIRVESRTNEGSSFYFSLLTNNTYPNALHSDPEETKPTAQEETVTGEPEKTTGNGKPILLVVEDNPDIRDYITDSFSDYYEVFTANEGEQGCMAAFAHVPDIIVSDIMMPGMNGIALTKIIKEDVRTSHIPIILLTAKDSLQDKEEGYQSGADSYLTKPFSATLLRSRINNLLENRKKLANQFSSNLKSDDKTARFKESINQLDNEFLRNITRLIEDNLESEKIDISYLSEKMFMSSSTLYRKIKALTGISTNEFVRKIKMVNAEKLMLEGKYTISEIAYRVGMNSPVYFRQCFKEEFGVTPSDYLRRLKE